MNAGIFIPVVLIFIFVAFLALFILFFTDEHEESSFSATAKPVKPDSPPSGIKNTMSSFEDDVSQITKSDNHDSAEEILALEKRLLLEPENLDLLGWLATLYSKSRNIEKAIDCYVALTGLRPNFEDYHFQLAGLYLESEKMAEAKTALDNVVRINPGSPLAIEATGIIERLF